MTGEAEKCEKRRWREEKMGEKDRAKLQQIVKQSLGAVGQATMHACVLDCVLCIHMYAC